MGFVIMMFLVLYIIFGLIRLLTRFAWRTAKVIFSIGLFFVSPLLFLLALFTGALGTGWFMILCIALICLGNLARPRVV